MSRGIELGDGRTIVVPAWVETARQKAARKKLLTGRFFLVSLHGGDLGEKLRCRRCKGKHDYLTRYCLELPFSGLKGSLWAYMQTASLAAADLPPEQRATLSALGAVLDGASLPDLSTSHPRMAAALRRSMVEPYVGGRFDIDLGAVAVGVVERIEPKDAQGLLDAINTRAALYRLPRVAVAGLVTV